MSDERVYHDIPAGNKDVELDRNLSRLSATLHKNGDLNKDRDQIEKLAQLLSRYVTTINRSELDRQQLLDGNADLTKQVNHYKSECSLLDGKLREATILLEEAARTYSKPIYAPNNDESVQVDALKVKNRMLESALADVEAKNNELQNRTLPTRTHSNVRALEDKISHQDRELEASKILHNKLVERLRQKDSFIENLENDIVVDGGSIGEPDHRDHELKHAQDIITQKDLQLQDLNEDVENLQARLRLLGGRGGHSKSVIFEEQENQIEADRMAIARLLTKQEKLSVRIVELEDQLNRRPVPMPMPRSPLKMSGIENSLPPLDTTGMNDTDWMDDINYTVIKNPILPHEQL